MSIFKKIINNEELRDIRGWWAPGIISFIVISFIVYCMYDDYSFYYGWSFWWRVIMSSFVFGSGFLYCVYFDGSKKSKVSTSQYLENVNGRIKVFWAVSLFWLIFLALMPGKMVKTNKGDCSQIDSSEYERP